MTSLQIDYQRQKEKYTGRYGEKTCVFYQVGSFYEIYQYKNDASSYIYDIANICNWHVAQKSDMKNNKEGGGLLMIGVPCISIDKYLEILLKHNYVIVVFTQSEQPGKKTRKLNFIVTPGVNDIITSSDKSNTHGSVYCTMVSVMKQGDKCHSSICGVDVNTGKSFVYHFSHNNMNVLMGELYKVCHAYATQEVLLLNTIQEIDVVTVLNLCNMKVHVVEKMFDLEYSKRLICDLYDKFTENVDTMVPIYDEFENSHISIQSFACLLNYIYEIDRQACVYLKKPRLLVSTEFLTLFNSAMHQLNIRNKGGESEKDLISILNKCVTKMGKREFTERICHPLLQSEDIKKRYDRIDLFLNTDKDNAKERHFQLCRDILKNIADVEKLQRRIVTGKIKHVEFKDLHLSYTHVLLLFNYLIKNDISERQLCKVKDVKDGLEKFMSDYTKHLDFEDADSMLHLDMYPNIRPSYEKQTQAQRKILNIFKEFEKKYATEKIHIKLEADKDYNFTIQSNPSKGEQLKQLVTTLDVPNTADDVQHITKFDFHFGGTVCKISCSELRKLSHEFAENKKITETMMNSEFEILLTRLKTYNKLFYDLTYVISDIDVCCTNAMVAFQNSYCRPIITNNTKGSELDIKNLRHPIIENIIDVSYVPNDVILQQSGMLIYGCNSAGKSSLMKSVGIAVVMAQSGMFTACERMKFTPFHKVFTRIVSKDDLFKHQSTFTSEMAELRNIFTFCDNHSLILSDELSSGTEITSALSIVTSAICQFDLHNVCYVMATHLHQIVDYPEIRHLKSINKLTVNHLYVYHDSKLQTLIFDRKLRPGAGHALYGLEICEYLSFGESFLTKANEIRGRILSGEHSTSEIKKSRYNSSVVLSTCSVCKNSSDHLETHHIYEQMHADQNGFIENKQNGTQRHKNVSSNLVSLCKQCHYNVTYGYITINGWITTSSGKKLDWTNS